VMHTKKKSNKSTHLCENEIVKIKARNRIMCTIGRPHNNMDEEEGSLALTSTKNEKTLLASSIC
jgi:hypothetical protein